MDEELIHRRLILFKGIEIYYFYTNLLDLGVRRKSRYNNRPRSYFIIFLFLIYIWLFKETYSLGTVAYLCIQYIYMTGKSIFSNCFSFCFSIIQSYYNNNCVKSWCVYQPSWARIWCTDTAGQFSFRLLGEDFWTCVIPYTYNNVLKKKKIPILSQSDRKI